MQHADTPIVRTATKDEMDRGESKSTSHDQGSLAASYLLYGGLFTYRVHEKKRRDNRIPIII